MKNAQPTPSERIVYAIPTHHAAGDAENRPQNAAEILRAAMAEPDALIRHELYAALPEPNPDDKSFVKRFRDVFEYDVNVNNRLKLLRWGAPALPRSPDLCDFYITVLNNLGADPRLRSAVFDYLKPVLETRSRRATLVEQQMHGLTVGPSGFLTLAEYAYEHGGDIAERIAAAETILRVLCHRNHDERRAKNTERHKDNETRLETFLNTVGRDGVYVRSAIYECIHREKLVNPTVTRWLLENFAHETPNSHFYILPPLACALTTAAENQPAVKAFIAQKLADPQCDRARRCALGEAVAAHFAEEPAYREAFAQWSNEMRARPSFPNGALGEREIAIWVNGVINAAPYDDRAAQQLGEWLDRLAAGEGGRVEQALMNALLNGGNNRTATEHIAALMLAKFSELLGREHTPPKVRGEIYRILDRTANDPQATPPTVERCRLLLTRRLTEERSPEALAALYGSLRLVTRTDQNTALQLARRLPHADPELRRGLYVSLAAAAHQPLIGGVLWDAMLHERDPDCLQTLLNHAGEIIGRRPEAVAAVMQNPQLDPLRRYHILSHLGHGLPLNQVAGPTELATLFTRNDPIGWVREGNIRAFNLDLEANQRWFKNAVRIPGPHQGLLLTALLEMKRVSFVVELCAEHPSALRAVRELLAHTGDERRPPWRHEEFEERIAELERKHIQRQWRWIETAPGPRTGALDAYDRRTSGEFRPRTLPPLDI